MDLKHFSHDHPLVFIQEWSRASEEEQEEEEGAYCFACEERVESPCYCCSGCKFYLHKTCAELELSPEVSHPFHPPHPLILLPKSPYPDSYGCDFCWGSFSGLVYHCASCEFDLDINCASIAGNFDKEEYPFHEHPLILIEKHNRTIRCNCLGCMKEISSSPFYKCLDCKMVYVHKECAELPLEINNFHHRRHPLTLLHYPPIHLENCSCYLCKIQWRGFVYYCNVCEFGLTPEDVSPLPEITTVNHEHPWTLLSRAMSFICDFCGTDGDRTPYLCTACNFIVHKSCISLPRIITIMRHHHRLSHSYFFLDNQSEKWECKICHKEVNKEYGRYYCPDSECNYIAHVNCATDRSVWDPKFNDDERSEGESINWITDVIQTKCLKGDEITTEIKHAFHDHNLILNFSGKVKDDINCDGCMRLISTPFYGCEQCRFFLHRNCAELPREKRHPSHKHLLGLTKNDALAFCHACDNRQHGFSYKCNVCYFEIDIQCSLLLDTFMHPSHKHLLFVDHNCHGNCNGCNNRRPLAYKCTQGCEFILDFECLTLPQIAWYKYDNHPLTLTYDSGSDPDQFYCDICEEERHPNRWFYYCADCDNTVHPECILGDFPFIKLGRILESYPHPHPITFVKNIWNCPRCNFCKKLCNGQALQCTECNLIFHWRCQANLQKLNGV